MDQAKHFIATFVNSNFNLRFKSKKYVTIFHFGNFNYYVLSTLLIFYLNLSRTQKKCKNIKTSYMQAMHSKYFSHRCSSH